ncbi:MAG: sigma-70 family RNA polymerase sigma factor [Coriobacteriales bacterium]|nr:sigma-70 family RNA polymerase sigma factor [Coriobacteriales bacterium]
MEKPSKVTATRYSVGMKTKTDIESAIEQHGNTVMRVCTLYLREPADRDDAFQETFLRYARNVRPFTGEEHKKAWLIRVTTNVCKDMLKRSSAQNESLEALSEQGYTPVGDDGGEGLRAVERSEVFDALRKLEDRYRVVLYLKFYENYTAAQIAKLLSIPENTVYTNLSRGKKQLKEVLSHGQE